MPDERILVVEDEATIGDLIAEGLRRHGYLVERARDGDTALDMAEILVPDLIVLDLMLPGMDGWEICRRIRQYRKTRDVPIIMLTARRDERDVVAGLELGADDYMKKPFSMNELMARVKALLRRSARKIPEEQQICEGPLGWDVGAGMFRFQEGVLDLSPTEYRLLEELVLRRGKVVPREELLHKVWGYYGGDSRTVDVHISRLRRKVEADPEHPLLVHTIRGRGYCLEWRGTE